LKVAGAFQLPRRGEFVLFSRRVLPLAALCVAALALPAAAAGWRADGAGSATSAGYAGAGGFETLWLSCTGLPPGQLAIRFSGFPAGLPLDAAYTVVVSADNLAFLQEVRPVARAGGYDLGRTAARAELQPLIDALKRGSKVEVSTPAGRRTLPLSGSGKALAALEAGCAP
jgi:hypothetical protein